MSPEGFRAFSSIPTRTVLENFLLGSYVWSRTTVWASTLDLRWSRREQSLAREEAVKMISLLGIEHLHSTRGGDLPSAQQKAVEIAGRW